MHTICPFLYATQIPTTANDHTHITDLHFADQYLVLTIYRPSYGVSMVVVVVYVVLLVTALALALLLVRQMKLLNRVKEHHKRTVEEQALRLAAEQTTAAQSSFFSFMSQYALSPLFLPLSVSLLMYHYVVRHLNRDISVCLSLSLASMEIIAKT